MVTKETNIHKTWLLKKRIFIKHGYLRNEYS